MNSSKQLTVIAAAMFLLSACSEPGGDSGGSTSSAAGNSQSTLSIDDLRAIPVLGASEYLSQPEYANADQEQGRRLYLQCIACHQLDADGINGPGPILAGLFGRKVGSVEGFAYSDALKAAAFNWTPQALDEWLARPLTMIPGSQMAFGGIRNAEQRTALIAYLLLNAGDTDSASE